MKKIIGLFLLAAMLLVFPGCKGDGSSVQNGTETKENEGTQNVEITNVTEEMVRNHKAAPASDFTYVRGEDGISIREYNGNDVIVVIPDTIDGQPVTEIWKLVFANDSPVKGIYLPDSIKQIEALCGNNDDLQVVICEGLEKVLEDSFLGCVNLHTVVLGENLTEFGEYAFGYCDKLEYLYIAPSLTNVNERIAGRVFHSADNLTIIGEAGSYIESFAAEQGIPFKAK